MSKPTSKANKYLAEWASLKLEKNDKDKELYIQEVIKADMEEPGKDDVLRKIKKVQQKYLSVVGSGPTRMSGKS